MTNKIGSKRTNDLNLILDASSTDKNDTKYKPTATATALPFLEQNVGSDLALLQESWGGQMSVATEEVAVLLSGGVDSSVALRLAMEDYGYKPRCFYLKIWLEDELAHLNQCPWEEDWAYATAVAKQAGVPLEAVSMQKEYWSEVVASTIAEADKGRTPNPDILCNSRIKFGVFHDSIGQHFQRVITGHYARAVHLAEGVDRMEAGHQDKTMDTNPKVRLVRSPDRVKDQTYFLSALSQKQLKHAVFPVGEFAKHEVRSLAIDRFDLPTQGRKDSQGICFLGKLRWEDFLGHYIDDKHGDVCELETGEWNRFCSLSPIPFVPTDGKQTNKKIKLYLSSLHEQEL